MATVVSDRVVELMPAVNNTERSRQLVLEDLVTDCGTIGAPFFKGKRMLKVVSADAPAGDLVFTAEAVQDCLGLEKGDQANIRLSLIGGKSCIYVNDQPFPVQLLVGPAVCNPEMMQRLMGPAQTAAAPAAAVAAAEP